VGHIAPGTKEAKEARLKEKERERERERERRREAEAERAKENDVGAADASRSSKAAKAVTREYALFRIGTDRRGVKVWTRVCSETMVCSYDEAAVMCKEANRFKAKGDRVTVMPVEKQGTLGDIMSGVVGRGGNKKKKQRERLEAAWRKEEEAGGVSGGILVRVEADGL
jgi:hypothetical protein